MNSSQALTLLHPPDLLGTPFRLSPTGLTVLGTPTEEEYRLAFSRLRSIEGALQWWYGDLANSYDLHYGDLKALAQELEIDYGTLRNAKWVASRYELSSRDDNLSWLHHRLAAPLEDGLDWLRWAAKKGWTTARLEAEIRGKRWANPKPLPPGKYRVIYADPPWAYDNSGLGGGAERHYPTIPVDEIKGLPVGGLADGDVALFLWVTAPFLPEGLEVCRTWGFDYKTHLIWIKNRPTYGKLGFYTYSQHELLLIATRGRCLPREEGLEPSVLFAPKQDHSRKPPLVYDLIEKMYPGPYVELFARNNRPGWTAWGQEIA